MNEVESNCDKALEFLRKSSTVIRTLKILATTGGAALLAFSSWQLSVAGGAAETYVHVLFWVGLVLTVLGSIFLTFVDKTTPEILAENLLLSTSKKQLVDNIEYSNGFADYLLTRVSLNSQLREILETAVTDGVSTEVALKDYLESVLGLLVARKSMLFSMEDESWNFAVYKFEHTVGKLKCCACIRSVELPENYSHRTWADGEGHVGLAYNRGTELVFTDATREELRPVIGAKNENYKDDDDELYKSLAAMPISKNGKDIEGILIATSSQIGRFKTETDRDEKDWDREDVLRLQTH